MKWGGTGAARAQPEHALDFLGGARWGSRRGIERPPSALDEVRLGPAAPGAGAARAAERPIVGADHVRDDREARVLHAAGKSYPDLVRQRAGDC